MTNNCIKTAHRLNQNPEVSDLSIEQLLLLAINGASGDVSEVAAVLELTDWGPHIIALCDLEIKESCDE